MAEQIRAYDALDAWLLDHGLTRTGFARKHGLNDRSFRHMMRRRDPGRRVSAEFAEKVHQATAGAVDRGLWVPVRS